MEVPPCDACCDCTRPKTPIPLFVGLRHSALALSRPVAKLFNEVIKYFWVFVLLKINAYRHTNLEKNNVPIFVRVATQSNHLGQEANLEQLPDISKGCDVATQSSHLNSY